MSGSTQHLWIIQLLEEWETFKCNPRKGRTCPIPWIKRPPSLVLVVCAWDLYFNFFHGHKLQDHDQAKCYQMKSSALNLTCDWWAGLVYTKYSGKHLEVKTMWDTWMSGSISLISGRSRRLPPYTVIRAGTIGPMWIGGQMNLASGQVDQGAKILVSSNHV